MSSMINPVTANGNVVASPNTSKGVHGGKKAWVYGMHPTLYESATKADVELLNSFFLLYGLREDAEVTINIPNWDSPPKESPLDGHTKPLLGLTCGGNTALHIVAGSSITDSRRTFAHLIHKKEPSTDNRRAFARSILKREPSLLKLRNKQGETALHCATNAGNLDMVTLLINFAKEERQDDHGDHSAEFRTFLRARNLHGETAMHEAVRFHDEELAEKLVEELLKEDQELASIVDNSGVSPFYMAAMEDFSSIVKVFTRRMGISCAGPRNQTALHAAVVLQNAGVTGELLNWDPALASRVDDQGDTPLHYAASVGNLKSVKLLLECADKSAIYTPNEKGMFPVHVAAENGWTEIIKELVMRCPDSHELRDKNGRNLLHVAIKNRNKKLADYLLGSPMCARMLNSRDSEGNTPLHIAVQKSSSHTVNAIISNNTSYSSIMNKDGFTPLDLAVKKASTPVLWFSLNPEYNIIRCLAWLGALPRPQPLTRDLKPCQEDTKKIGGQEKDLKEDTNKIGGQEKDLKEDTNKIGGQEKEQEKYKNIASNISIGSVLVATVTFAAMFTMPGGYFTMQDSKDGTPGTPVLSRKYAFKVFIISDTFAFLLSILSTIYIMYSGSTNINWKLRQRCLFVSVIMMIYASKAFVCGFAAAVFVILSPVNFRVSILVCVIAALTLFYNHPMYHTFIKIALPVCKRLGIRGLFASHLHPATTKRIPVRISSNITKPITWNALCLLAFYGAIFGFACL